MSSGAEPSGLSPAGRVDDSVVVVADATAPDTRMPGGDVGGTDSPVTGYAFASATFLGAFLLFVVQPMVGRYILPWFGGGAAVWTTCLLFFQAALLGGYLYAHLGVSRLRPRGQSLVHAVLLLAAVAAAALGAVPSERWKPPAGDEFPAGRILALLAASVGLPCLVLSATSPLLHAWYVRARPAAGAGVYRLYALSNAGSLLALLGYPFLIEPALTRRAQANLWTAGLALYALLCGYCAWRAAAAARRDGTGSGGGGQPSAAGTDTPGDLATARPGVRRRLMWVALPACASVLLLATTNTMTQDLAPVPLLWVLPLALYLLTFILAFEWGRVYRRRAFGWLLALSAAAVCWTLIQTHESLAMKYRIGILAGAMFVCCMVLHGELARLQPPTRFLTGYYLAIAAGGALGGLLVAVGAPLVLDRYAELHVGLWLCCLLAFIAPAVVRAGPGGGGGGGGAGHPDRPPALDILAVVGLVVLGAWLWWAATRLPGTLAPVARTRDFYGAIAVYRAHSTRGGEDSLWLYHGSIIHGQQFLAPSRRGTPTTYYTPFSGVGRVLRDPYFDGRPRRVGVVGLGAGTLAAYGRPGDVFRFYEISPNMAALARDPFSYLRDSGAACEVVLGDGRISLEREPPQAFDVLVLDAFSGDAIPVHLLTAEAFAVYRRHLAPGGVVVVHVTNGYVSLWPVLARLSGYLGWTGALVVDAEPHLQVASSPSDWVVLAPDPARLEHVRRNGGRIMRPDVPVDLWTDERSNLFKVLR